MSHRRASVASGTGTTDPRGGTGEGVVGGVAEWLQTVIRPALPVDLRLTLGPLRRGRADPSMGVDPSGAWWRATRTPDGPATTRFLQWGGQIEARAWGPGAAWALGAAPEVLGTRDSLEGFEPGRGLVREVHRRFPGLRIPRSNAVFEALVPSILEQRVVGSEARASYRRLLWRWGEPAPGPCRLRLPPSAAALARVPYYAFHPLGVERQRATTVREAALRARRLEEALSLPLPKARARLRAVPGVGPWTAAEVALVALGDADAVPVGDYHLPDTVAWALAGEARGDDARMLELLQPYAGHRGRVVRLLQAAGIAAPRFGPRQRLHDFARC